MFSKKLNVFILSALYELLTPSSNKQQISLYVGVYFTCIRKHEYYKFFHFYSLNNGFGKSDNTSYIYFGVQDQYSSFHDNISGYKYIFNYDRH